MDMFSSVNWSGFLGPLTTFVAAFLAYLLAQRTYRRQKEYELVRSRYLDGGVDRFADLGPARDITDPQALHISGAIRSNSNSAASGKTLNPP
jgi:hypothetical protein